jgi:hypothetical protein
LVNQGDDTLVAKAEAAALIAVHVREDKLGPHSQRPPVQPLTIAEAKASLAQTFGVTPDKIEIIIRG